MSVNARGIDETEEGLNRLSLPELGERIEMNRLGIKMMIARLLITLRSSKVGATQEIRKRLESDCIEYLKSQRRRS